MLHDYDISVPVPKEIEFMRFDQCSRTEIDFLIEAFNALIIALKLNGNDLTQL